jgi:hypothetical protein
MAALLLWAPAVLAAEAGGGEAKQPPRESRLPGEYVGIANRLKLDDATRAKFEEAVKANEKVRAVWRQTTFAKVGELSAALREARNAKDEALVKEIEAEQKRFGAASLAKMEADCTARIMALLNDEQKAVWQGFELRRFLMASLWLTKFSDEQTDKLQTLCEEKVKTLPAITDDEYRAARDKVYPALRKEVLETILTDEQRAARNKPPEKKPEPRKEEPKKE